MKDWKDLAYNAHTILKDYYSYEEISYMPIKSLLTEIDYMTPKLKEIAQRQETERVKAELGGRPPQKKPGAGRH